MFNWNQLVRYSSYDNTLWQPDNIQMLSAFMREYFKNNDITWAQQIWTFCDCFILQIWDALSEW